MSILKKIKRIIKFPFLFVFSTGVFYKFYKIINENIEYEVSKKISYRNNKVLDEIFSDHVVRNGCFKGMQYPDFKSYGSSIYPKLLGYYEPELFNVFETICKTKYSEIIDIGSADGYYAVGLAMRLKNAKVYAFDINSSANKQCKLMAELNKVSDRVFIKDNCDADTLKNFHFSKKGLVISDCEGFEKKLFNISNLPNLSNCDLLIELHDFVDPNISNYIFDLFEKTHNSLILRSMDDKLKLNKQLSDSGYIEIKHLKIKDQFHAVAECRRLTIEWVFLTPRIALYS
jgi:hypothetical protein